MITTDYITGNTFKTLSKIYLDEDKPYITKEELNKNSDIIFVKSDYISKFKQKILPLINYKFKLITHNSDTAMPYPYIDLLEDNRLLHWYGMNANLEHNKFTPIPIGIANEKWPHGNKQKLFDISQKNNKKDKLVYCNFDPDTTYYRYEIIQKLKNKSFIDFDFVKRPVEEYWNIMSQYQYIISPRGNSIDCHRVWEAIYLGVVPIIENHIAMNNFKELPILFIDTWESLSIEYLLKFYKNIINNNEKALFNHYKTLII
jgi:hypothetical protein